MNKDINKTLMALVPILRMNGENVTNIEAVHDWYKAGDRVYMKEVAEITYDNGTVRYADIGCDSNLTAIYDVIAVIQQIKPRSKAIERIERGVYSLPSAQPEHTVTHSCDSERTETHDLVSRRAALEAMDTWDKFGCDPDGKLVRYDDDKHYVPYVRYEDMVYAVKNLPSAQPRWIPVTERLPEEDVEVLISYRYKEGEGDTSHTDIDITSYGQMYFGGNKVGNHKHWRAPFEYFESNYEVVAWMPIPEPYAERRTDE